MTPEVLDKVIQQENERLKTPRRTQQTLLSKGKLDKMCKFKKDFYQA